jgi:hypothetical protein
MTIENNPCEALHDNVYNHPPSPRDGSQSSHIRKPSPTRENEQDRWAHEARIAAVFLVRRSTCYGRTQLESIEED